MSTTTPHINMGNCPSARHPLARDYSCAACQELMHTATTEESKLSEADEARSLADAIEGLLNGPKAGKGMLAQEAVTLLVKVRAYLASRPSPPALAQGDEPVAWRWEYFGTHYTDDPELLAHMKRAGVNMVPIYAAPAPQPEAGPSMDVEALLSDLCAQADRAESVGEEESAHKWLRYVRQVRTLARQLSAVDPDSVPVPQNARQAEMMEKVGYAWLKQNAPERLMPIAEGRQLSAAQVPEGMVLVPEKPTEEMFRAACRFHPDRYVINGIYRNLLAALPAQPQEQSHE